MIDTNVGILLKPRKPFAETTLSNVAGCLKFPSVVKKNLDEKLIKKANGLTSCEVKKL